MINGFDKYVLHAVVKWNRAAGIGRVRFPPVAIRIINVNSRSVQCGKYSQWCAKNWATKIKCQRSSIQSAVVICTWKLNGEKSIVKIKWNWVENENRTRIFSWFFFFFYFHFLLFLKWASTTTWAQFSHSMRASVNLILLILQQRKKKLFDPLSNFSHYIQFSFMCINFIICLSDYLHTWIYKVCTVDWRANCVY